MNACPSKEQLACFLAEELQAAQGTALEEHIEHCSECQQALDQLSTVSGKGDPVAAEIRVTSHAMTPEFLDRLKSRFSGGQEMTDTLHAAASANRTLSGGAEMPSVPGYEILAEQGRGGMGVVYKARHLGLNRLVALKMLLAVRFVTPDSRERFRREALAIARLRHPNIVQVYDVGETEAGPFFSLELIAAGSLGKRLDGTPWAPRAAAAFLERLARAIHYAHEQGIIHRDLKPGNILLKDEGDALKDSTAVADSSGIAHPSLFMPIITDFGLAKCVEDQSTQTPDGTILGTPSYLAPEQVAATAEPVGPATDVYGLGAILYELLTGRPPFQAESVLATLLQVTHHEPRSPSRLGIHVPRDLETICLKCLRKSAGNRYASAELLAADLHRFLVGEPIQARPQGPAERTIKWMKRNPALALLLAGFMVAVLLGSASAAWFVLDRQARAAHVERDVNRAVEETISLHGRAQGAGRNLSLWADALASARKAEAIATTGNASPALRGRVGTLVDEITRSEKDHRLMATLQEIQASMGDDLLANGDQDFASTDQRYATAFLAFDRMKMDELDVEEGAKLLSALGAAVRVEVAAALDNWGYVRFVLKTTKARLTKDPSHLHRMSGLLDPDPVRNQVRAAIMNRDAVALRKLAAQMDPAAQPVQTVNLVAVYLYWLSPSRGYAEEIAFLQAAQVQHAGDFQINHNLAYWLLRAGRPEEALPYARVAVAVRANSATAWQDVAGALSPTKRASEALVAHRRVMDLAPRAVKHLARIGEILQMQGKDSEAAVVYRVAAKRVPKYDPLHTGFLASWKKFALLDEVAAEYRKVIAENPADLDTHLGLCNVLVWQSRWVELTAEYEAILQIDPTNPLHHDRLGSALTQQGKHAAAVEVYRQCLALNPKLEMASVGLNNALHLAALEKRLPAALAGEPTSIADLLSMADLCQRGQKRTRAGAALYARALAADPQLGDDPTMGKHYRYKAACVAALAASGVGADAKNLGMAENAQLRRQAFDWLQRELAARGNLLKTNPKAASQTHYFLRYWQKDPDLVSVRDGKELARLGADERCSWVKFWDAVDRNSREARSIFTKIEHKGQLDYHTREKHYPIQMIAGIVYQIDMQSPQFDTYLRLEDAQGKMVAENNDVSPTDRNSRIVFTAPGDGAYRIVATSLLQGRAGAYTVRAFEVVPAAK